jgi:hypothetical protein
LAKYLTTVRVLGAVALSQTRPVVVEVDIENPMEAVVDAPMRVAEGPL